MSENSTISYKEMECAPVSQCKESSIEVEKKLKERVRILEVFLGEQLNEIPDYHTLFLKKQEDLNIIFLQWIRERSLLKLSAAITLVAEFETDRTRLLIRALEYALNEINDESLYYDVIDELLKFKSINFTRILSDTNIAKRQRLSSIGANRFNDIIPILMKYEGKFNHIYTLLVENEQYLTEANRALILSNSNGLNNPTSIESVYRVLCKFSNAQLLDICLLNGSPAHCFVALQILHNDSTISSSEIKRICVILSNKGTAGKVSALLLQEKDGYGICSKTIQKRVLDGDYEEFMNLVTQTETKRKIQEASSLEGSIAEFQFAAQLMHHYMFISLEVPLLGILPRQCIDVVPTSTQKRNYRILKVLQQEKIMVLSEVTDMSREALTIPLLNIGDEVELKFSCPADILIPEVVGCRLAKVVIKNMPKWLDYKKIHHAVVVSQTSFVNYTLKLVSK